MKKKTLTRRRENVAYKFKSNCFHNYPLQNKTHKKPNQIYVKKRFTQTQLFLIFDQKFHLNIEPIINTNTLTTKLHNIFFFKEKTKPLKQGEEML